MRHQLQMHYLVAVAKVGSIRKAADLLAITSSALNRRILAMEEDLGVPLFDRVSSGVRLNAAGGLLIQHFNQQIADMDRVKSQIHDLQGIRRGHVSITSSQVFMDSVLPAEILKYQKQHPNVTFSVSVCTRETAALNLRSFKSDIALVFDPELSADFHTMAVAQQTLHAQFRKDHALDETGAIRFRDCLVWPQALPTKNNGIRHVLERAAAARSTPLNVSIESDNFFLLRTMVRQSDVISFTLTAGIDCELDELCHRPIDSKDLPSANLHLGSLKDRHLSVAAAKFAEQLAEAIETRW